jgi:hypothetical protein
MTRGFRKVHGEELHHLFYSPRKIRAITGRRMKSAEHVGRMGKKRKAYRILL